MPNWSDNQPFFKSHKVAIGIGATLIVAGMLCLYDAYEGRGSSTPFWIKFLPSI